MTDHLTSSPFDPAVVAEPDLAVVDDAVSAAEPFPTGVPSAVPSPPTYMPPAATPAGPPSAVLPQSSPVKRRGKLAVIAAAAVLATIVAATFGGLYLTAKADLDDSKAEVSRLSARIASQQDELDLADRKAKEMQSTIDDQAAEVEQISEDLADAQDDFAAADESGDLCREASDEWQDQALRLARVLDALAAQDAEDARTLMEEVAESSQEAIDATAACHLAVN